MQLPDLPRSHLPLMAEHLQPGVDGVVPLHGKLDIQPDILDGHSGFFHAADDPQPLEVALPEHSDAAGGTLHKGKQPLFVVAAQSKGRHAKFICRFAHGIDHLKTPFF